MMLLLVLAVALLAYANGANDNIKAAATVYGSGTLGYRATLAVATLAQLAGSAASIALASGLVQGFSGRGLVGPEAVAEPGFLVAVGFGAAIVVLAATRLGMPVSTTHALIGGLVGAGLAFAPGELEWRSLQGRFLLPLLASPAVAAVGAAVAYPVASAVRMRLGVDEVTCVCIGNTIEPVGVGADGTAVVARTGMVLAADQAAACRRRYDGRVVGVSAQRVVDGMHVASATALGFARALNDTPKVIALLVAASWSGLHGRAGLLLVAGLMAAGGLIHSRRLAATLGRRITEMNHGQGFVANAVASSLVIAASILGLPVSTTHVATGAIFGIGACTGRARWDVVGAIAAAWLVTLPAALAAAFCVAEALAA